MIFTVIWTRPARNALADIWTQGPDRQAITEASHRIDQELRVDAHWKGRTLGSHYVWIDPPLIVSFTVDLDDRMVKIFLVRRTS
jgi:hypothetical protein